jgi:hypothetical protein
LFQKDRNGVINKNDMIKVIEAIFDFIGEDNRFGINSPSNRVDKIFRKYKYSQLLTENEFITKAIDYHYSTKNEQDDETEYEGEDEGEDEEEEGGEEEEGEGEEVEYETE